ncbi:MAG: hypothetical protein ACW99U_19895, partial [Candidatus Thorarchaeota archaeon]
WFKKKHKHKKRSRKHTGNPNWQRRESENYRLESSCHNIDGDLAVSVDDALEPVRQDSGAVLYVAKVVAALRDKQGKYFIAIGQSVACAESCAKWIPGEKRRTLVPQNILDCMAVSLLRLYGRLFVEGILGT